MTQPDAETTKTTLDERDSACVDPVDDFLWKHDSIESVHHENDSIPILRSELRDEMLIDVVVPV